MELNLRNIQQLNSHQIFEVLLPVINEVYQKYDFIGIKKENFYHLVLEEIDKSKTIYNEDVSYIEYIKNNMNTILFNQTKNSLLEPTFSQMMSVLTVKKSVIISLKLGYIDGKYFSTDSIAQFLGIETQEVIDITKKVLFLYKDSIIQFIDKAIQIVTEESNQLKRKL